jgi:hypothetical protein
VNKNLILIPLILLLFACSKSDQDYVENCADNKTYEYWQEQYLANMKRYQRSKLSFYKKQAERFKNAKKLDLDKKFLYYSRYHNNFKKCEIEFKENPIYFKEIHG